MPVEGRNHSTTKHVKKILGKPREGKTSPKSNPHRESLGGQGGGSLKMTGTAKMGENLKKKVGQQSQRGCGGSGGGNAS